MRAAARPGRAAIAFASTSAPAATSTTDNTGTMGWGTAKIWRANRIQSHLPSTMPSGIPNTNPIAAAVDA